MSKAQSETLARHYREAIKILRQALQEHPEDTALQLELGRAYLAMREDGKAQRLFGEILKKEPRNKEAQLDLARSLAYQRRYERSDDLYRQVLTADPSNEAAAIGLTSNLMHEGRSVDAARIADTALWYHPNSLRLLESKDRISSGLLGGDEPGSPIAANVISAATDYINDSAGNHSWRVMERLELGIKPGVLLSRGAAVPEDARLDAPDRTKEWPGR